MLYVFIKRSSAYAEEHLMKTFIVQLLRSLCISATDPVAISMSIDMRARAMVNHRTQIHYSNHHKSQVGQIDVAGERPRTPPSER